MTTKTIAGILAVAACGATLAMASCDSNSTNPGTSPQAADAGSKNTNVLTDCASIFAGIEHCAIGTAALAANAAAGTVTMTAFDADGGDGVSSSFADAGEWSQRATADYGTRTGATLHLEAISGGQTVSKLHVARANATKLDFTPTFTAGNGGSSSFHVHVYNDGVLVGGEIGIDPNTTISIFGIYTAGDDDRDGGDRRRKFKRHHAQQRNAAPTWQSPGACEWSETVLDPNVTFSVQLPNGTTLDGDEVLFTEEVAAGQAVYNDFQRIDVTGNLGSYTITGESSVPAE